MSLPLAGVRILDCSRLMPFAYGTQLLVDAGAEVVKLEAPGGEYGRGMVQPFRITNRGKRSLTLDLHKAEGVSMFLELCKGFDALLESFRPGFLERLGVGYEPVSAANPAIVYCSGTGYGQTGPFADRPGHDANYAALAGVLKPQGEEPTIPHLPFVDMVAGWAAAYGILTGIVQAKVSGRGSRVDVSMTEVALSLNSLAIAEETAPDADAGTGPLAGYPWPDLMLQRTPSYGVFETADGAWITLANSEPKFWAEMLAEMGLSHLEDTRFAIGEEGARAHEEVSAAVRGRTAAEWDEAFAGKEVCYQRVNTPAAAVEEPQFRERGASQPMPGGGWAIYLPILFAGAPRPAPAPVPEAGEANAEIYGALGHGPDELERLRAAGVI
jgi:alpha-methylacyl-CoA racemase